MFANQRGPPGKPETSQSFKPFTSDESERISSALDRNLGPEFVSIRPGPGANKLSYLEGWKAIQLSNQIFGFNGWNTEVRTVQVDYVDEQAGKFSVGLSVIVRVTLKDGSYHEDIGYGNIENCRTKAAAFDKCKKEATTDAMKRALRQFGNALGNCLYDKTYLHNVTKITKNQNIFDSESLIRGPDSLSGTINNPHRPASSINPQPLPQQQVNANAPQQRQASRSQVSNAQQAPQKQQNPIKHESVKTEIAQGAGSKVSNNDLEDIIDDESFAFSDDILPEDLPDSDPEFDNKMDDYEMQLIMGKHESQAKEEEEKLAEEESNTTLTGTSGNGNGNANNTLPSYLNTPTPAAAQQQKQQQEKQGQPGAQQSQQTSSQQQNTAPANLPPPIWVSARLADEVNNNVPLKPEQAYNPNFTSPSLRKTSNIDHSKSTPIKRSAIASDTPQHNKENNQSTINSKSGPKRPLGLAPTNSQSNKRQQKS